MPLERGFFFKRMYEACEMDSGKPSLEISEEDEFSYKEHT
jgi:hypothetical protein